MNKAHAVSEASIDHSISILNAIKKMDELKRKLLIVNKNGKYLSLLSIGDIQRAIIRNISFDTKVENILRDSVQVAQEGESMQAIRSRMLKYRMEMLPVLNSDREIIEVHFWNSLVGEDYRKEHGSLSIPVVVMAGGKGTRLKPITNIIPKALIPIDERPIVEVIIDKFRRMGAKKFYLTVNHKAEMIQSYFEQGKRDYEIVYIREEKPLGTAGSLSLLKDHLNETFIISNCDIIIEEDYNEIYNYHKREKNELTIVAALKHYSIPYGILETKDKGQLTRITEKPELTYQVNSGMYFLEPNLLNEIPSNEFFHITHLIEKILNRGGRVGVFPVSQGSWMDIGVWSEYNRTRKRLGAEMGFE